MLAGACLRLSDQKNRNPYPQCKAIHSISTAKDRSQREFIFGIYRCSQMLQILQHCIYWNALDVLSAANIQTFMTAIHSISIPRSPSKHVNSNILCLRLMCMTCQNVDRRIKVAESTKWFASHNKNKSTVTKAREGEPKSYLTEYLCSKKRNALYANMYTQSDEVTINSLFKAVFLHRNTLNMSGRLTHLLG